MHCPVRFPTLTAAVHRRVTSSAVTQLGSRGGERAAVRAHLIHRVRLAAVVEGVGQVQKGVHHSSAVYGLGFSVQGFLRFGVKG
jgi:hypothetical protein